MLARTFGALLVVIGCSVFPADVRADEEAQPKTLRIASVSIFPEKWNKDANAAKIEKLVRDAAGQGAKLVITPEGVLEGYVVNKVIREKDPAKKAALTERFRQIAEPINGPYVKRFAGLAKELDIHLILGFLERDADGQRTYNTAALFGPDGNLVGKYHKTHFAQGYKVNPPGYEPGKKYPVFDIGALKVGMMICFDRQPPEPARHLALEGADLIACPSYGAWGEWNTNLMRVRAYENHTYVVFTHPEQSLIIDRGGKVVADGSKDSVTIRDLDIAQLRKTRAAIVNRRPKTYRNQPQAAGDSQ